MSDVFSYSALELFLVKRKIKGPCWLSLSSIVSCPPAQRVYPILSCLNEKIYITFFCDEGFL